MIIYVPHRKGGEQSTSKEDVYFLPAAFLADLVSFPPPSFLSTDLMTPTATVCLMSRTAKRPRGGYLEKASTHIGLLGVRTAIAASPDLTNLGLSSIFLPERRSIPM